MKEKVYGICLTKVFREESYGQPEISLCKTREKTGCGMLSFRRLIY